MLQKRMYKVLSMLPKKDGGTYWMRCGSAFTNKDDSINVILDALPRGEWKFQLRELDEEDLRKRESPRTGAPAARSDPSSFSLSSPTSTSDVPF